MSSFKQPAAVIGLTANAISLVWLSVLHRQQLEHQAKIGELEAKLTAAIANTNANFAALGNKIESSHAITGANLSELNDDVSEAKESQDNVVDVIDSLVNILEQAGTVDSNASATLLEKLPPKEVPKSRRDVRRGGRHTDKSSVSANRAKYPPISIASSAIASKKMHEMRSIGTPGRQAAPTATVELADDEANEPSDIVKTIMARRRNQQAA